MSNLKKLSDEHPALAGFIRGLVHAVLIGAISAGINYFSTASIPDSYAAYAAFIVALLRTLEGFIDANNPPKS